MKSTKTGTFSQAHYPTFPLEKLISDILDRSPLHNLKLFKEASKREVNLSPEQAGSLINALPPTVGSIVGFALYTGLRKENIPGLEIENIQFHDLSLTAEITVLLNGGKRRNKLFCQNAVGLAARNWKNEGETGQNWQNKGDAPMSCLSAIHASP